MPTFIVGTKVVVARDRERAMRHALALCATRHAVTSDTTWSTLEVEYKHPLGWAYESWPVRQLSRRSAPLVRAYLDGSLRVAAGTLLYMAGVICKYGAFDRSPGARELAFGLLGVRGQPPYGVMK